MANHLALPPQLKQYLAAFPEDTPIYLVGGAVRDMLLQRQIHDYDFVLAGDTLKICRSIADKIGAAYFPLDTERGTVRLIFTDDQGTRNNLDFAKYRGPDLDSDLRRRDFTINALALDIRKPSELFDPLGGAVDLHNKHIRACSPTSLIDDPVRYRLLH